MLVILTFDLNILLLTWNPINGAFTHYATQNKTLSILSSLEQILPNAKVRDQVGQLQGSRMLGLDVLLDRLSCI